jgi:N-ethylmaleimide reductase
MPEDPEVLDMLTYLGGEATRRGLGYLHIVVKHSTAVGTYRPVGDEVLQTLRAAYKGAIMPCGGMTHETGERLLQAGLADLVAFGRPFLANPDLPERLRRNAPLQTPDPTTFYGGGARGYIDYPFLAA